MPVCQSLVGLGPYAPEPTVATPVARFGYVQTGLSVTEKVRVTDPPPWTFTWCERRRSMSVSKEQRFAAIYRAHSRSVLAYCRRRTNPDDVDDAAADVFMTVWRRIDDAPTGEDLLPWLYRVAYLSLSNRWRSAGRQKRLREKLESVGEPESALVHDQVVIRQELQDVLSAARRLRPQDQEILRLAMWESLSTSQIAAVFDIDPNTAKQRLHRARKALIKEHERMKQRSTTSPAALEGGGW